jgi:Protein of unknown function (DUF2846)
MKRIIVLVVLISVATIGFGQSSQDSATSEKAKVYFLRNTGYMGSAAGFKTFIDSQFVCRLNNKRFSIHEVAAGKHSFTVQFGGTSLKEKAERFELDLVAGKSYYIRVVFKTGAFVNNVYCEEVTETTAKREMEKLKEDTDCE